MSLALLFKDVVLFSFGEAPQVLCDVYFITRTMRGERRDGPKPVPIQDVWFPSSILRKRMRY